MTNRFTPCPPRGQTAAPNEIADPCTYLPKLRAAYYALLSGQATATIRDRDRWIEFHASNKGEMRAEITKLERMCPQSPTNPHGGPNSAVRAGPYSRTPGVHPGMIRRY